jgi:hypothetical protein
MNKHQEGDKPKLSLKGFFSLGDVGRYFFRGRSEAKPANVNVRIMHGINKLAIVIFLAGVIYIVFKHYIF